MNMKFDLDNKLIDITRTN